MAGSNHLNLLTADLDQWREWATPFWNLVASLLSWWVLSCKWLRWLQVVKSSMRDFLPLHHWQCQCPKMWLHSPWTHHLMLPNKQGNAQNQLMLRVCHPCPLMCLTGQIVTALYMRQGQENLLRGLCQSWIRSRLCGAVSKHWGIDWAARSRRCELIISGFTVAALHRLPCCGTSEAPSTLEALVAVRVNIRINTVLFCTHTHGCTDTLKTNENLL